MINMFDFHIHTRVSFDSEAVPRDVILAAEQKGISEICFTDHFDCHSDKLARHDLFAPEDYLSEYGSVSSDKILIRRGIEFGLTEWNAYMMEDLEKKIDFDFVLGSLHFVNGVDPYFSEFWVGKEPHAAMISYLDKTLECLKLHNNFDVLAHLNYVSRSANNPTGKPIYYKDCREVADEIMKHLVKEGKGLEVNTSGRDRIGDFTPSLDYLKRFRELGGEIVTVGSDAHTPERVGEYTREASEMISEVFGYVCTFEKRKPIFHKL